MDYFQIRMRVLLERPLSYSGRSKKWGEKASTYQMT